MQAGPLRRPPAALAGDQLEPAVGLAHEDRLEDPELPDAVDEAGQRLLVERAPRLDAGWGSDVTDRNIAVPASADRPAVRAPPR